MKTAVDFLVETLAENGILHSSDIEQAKEMFEQQIEDAYHEGSFAQMRYLDDDEYANAEQYYNETFKNK